MRDHEAHSSGGKSSPVPPATGPGEEIPGKREGSSGPTSEETALCALIIQKIPLCKVCERTTSTQSKE